MSDLIGVAIEASTIRAARKSGSSFEFAETTFDANAPDVAITALAAQFGRVRGIALSVGVGYLEIAEPDLPPLSAEEQRRVLLRDTDRFFPVEDALAVSAPDTARLAFAVSSPLLQQWVRALEAWAPVVSIVAAPVAVAAAVSVVHRGAPDGDRTLIVDAGANEIGIVSLKRGVLAEVRRVPAQLQSTVPAGAEPLSAVYLPGAKGEYAAAIGAMSFAGSAPSSMLLDQQLEQSFRARRVRQQWASVALVCLAAFALIVAIDKRQDRVLQHTQQVADSLSRVAEPARQKRTRVEQLDREGRMLRADDATSDALEVLALLGRSLPGDAFVERVNWDGAEWRIDGSADKAAEIIPRLEAVASIEAVRPLNASTRFRDGAKTRETFAVAFRVRGKQIGAR